MSVISPKAVVANPAGLAGDVRVGPFSFIGPEVTVGAGTVIDNNVTVGGATSIGSGCRLLPGCIVGAPPAAAGAGAGGCAVADGTVIREHVTVCAGAGGAGGGTSVGPNSLLMVGCQVGHDAAIEGDGIFANFTRIEHHARVERFVQTSGFCSVGAYATVGAYTFTTGYASLERDVPPYAIVQGHPVRVRGVNSVKLRRCGFDEQTIEVLKSAFRVLFDGEADVPGPQQLQAAETEYDNDSVRNLIAALRRSAASPTGRCLQPEAPAPSEP